ncbi:NADP-dependent oxidoreductase domain-containing protein [Lipomyces orientalis]|uniref:NADP-dependent oxidoreductase domain-containing protein n=1 Tax=Lipomyces orientalis TaxID=1233043 RepID=A0ACC3TLL4_9ASCO
MSTGRTFKLNDGNVIPALGLGTWQSPDKEVYEAVLIALKTGYRHIDAAFCYGNEVPVGRAIKDSGVPRGTIFLTSKLWSTGHTRVAEDLEVSLKNLGVDYLDLYLMHWPVTLNPKGNHPLLPTTPSGARDLLPEEEWNYIKTWEAMQALLGTGKVKSIGVANFSTHHLEQLDSAHTTTVVPAVNQVEMHPYNPQEKLVKYCNEKGIHLTAYSPLGSTSAPLQEEAVVKTVGERLGQSPAQVLISWAIWRGTSVIPKSVTPSRIASNFEDFILSDTDGKLVNEISKTTHKRIVLPNWGVKIFYDDSD